MKTKSLWIFASAALLLAIGMGACRDENVERVGLCPEVLLTDPLDLAVNVPLDQVITVTFNEALAPSTITPSVFELSSPGGGARILADISGTLTYDDEAFTLTFTPNSPLVANTTYSAVVKSTIKDLLGNEMQADYLWTFSTGSSVAPVVIATSPIDEATGVFLNKVIEVTFSAPIAPASVSATSFTVMEGSNAVTGAFSFSGSKVFFTPSSDLIASTLYTATLTTAIQNQGGVALDSDYEWTFTTGATTAPQVESTNPIDNQVDVALDQEVSAMFSETMDPLTITATTFTLMLDNVLVDGQVNYSGTTAVFTPDVNLLSGNVYTATITTGAESESGIALEEDYVWTFTMVDPLGPGLLDLKSVAAFGIIAGVGVSNNAGFSEIRNLNVGIYPGVRSSITGFPPAIIVNGSMFASDDTAPAGVAAMLLAAKDDLVEVYNFAESATTPAPQTVSGDQGGTTLAPGIYRTTSSLLIQSGDLVLDGQGDVNAVWIFQIGSDFTTVGGAGGSVILIGGAQAKNIFWQTGSSATIGDGTVFQGNVLALTSITMNSGAVAYGRMLARNGSVVMTNANIIEKP